MRSIRQKVSTSSRKCLKLSKELISKMYEIEIFKVFFRVPFSCFICSKMNNKANEFQLNQFNVWLYKLKCLLLCNNVGQISIQIHYRHHNKWLNSIAFPSINAFLKLKQTEREITLLAFIHAYIRTSFNGSFV